MSTDGIEAEPKRRKVKRKSYMEECKNMERREDRNYARIETIKIILSKVEYTDSSKPLMVTVMALLDEML